MITFLSGVVAAVSEKRLVLDVNHIGFQMGISARDAARMPAVGETVTIHTYMSVREDAISLYGFLQESDLEMYKLMLGVSGIGPKAALGILSVLSAEEISAAVVTDNEKAIAKAPGVGLKSARKMILELKDKIKLDTLLEAAAGAGDGAVDAAFEAEKQEAIQVMMALGYSNAEALRAVRKAKLTPDMDADQILNAALAAEH